MGDRNGMTSHGVNGKGRSMRAAEPDNSSGKGKKRMRKVMKNARGLISDLFAREKFSFWMLYGDGPNSWKKKNNQNQSSFSSQPSNSNRHGGQQRQQQQPQPQLPPPPLHPKQQQRQQHRQQQQQLQQQRQQQQQQQQQQYRSHQHLGGPANSTHHHYHHNQQHHHQHNQRRQNGAENSRSEQSSSSKNDKRSTNVVPHELDHADPLDSIGSLSESEAMAEENRLTRTQRTALDTLSTIDSDDNWDEFEKETPVMKMFDDVAASVLPQLFIGAFLAEQNKEDLEKKKMTHILQVGDNLTRSYEGEYHYKTIIVGDESSANLLVHFRECFLFIEEAKSAGGGTGCVLVHCFAGISRSATVCIGYLMWKLNLSLGAAYSLVERARACTQPNEGFREQLQIFENMGGDLDILDEWIEDNRDYEFRSRAPSNPLMSSGDVDSSDTDSD